MYIITVLKSIIGRLTDLLPIKNVIIFESYPHYSDNTKSVFDELVRRGWNKKYKFVWVCETEADVQSMKKISADFVNFKCVCMDSYIYKLYYKKVAKAFIVCNKMLHKNKPGKQYYCHLMHGATIKNTLGKYSLPQACRPADIITLSEFIGKYDAHNLMCEETRLISLGYARNDDLFDKIDIAKVFPDKSFGKIIYWLPTYRQHRYGNNTIHSNISMPIIHNVEAAAEINECAKRNGVLIIVKVHHAQDLSKITEYEFSNLIFIKNNFFEDKSFTNYHLLGSSDALISDYSSVYYDYLLCDKPIALCWEDFAEYEKREGFTVNPYEMLAGGEKVYTVEDFCSFITAVANGEDKLCDIRRELCDKVHKYKDNKSTQRIVDYLETRILK